MQIVPYAGWSNCLRLSYSDIELVVTLQVGPRIIRFGKIGKKNIFKEYPEQLGRTNEEIYHSYGGHRLWIAPEIAGRTDLPDNSMTALNQDKDTYIITAPIEDRTFLQKEIRISMNETNVIVEHRIYNQGLYPVTCAPWAITVMTEGGVGIVPQEEFQSHSQKLLPVRPLVLWAYTNMADDRWTWGQKMIKLSQREGGPQKIGALVTKGWAAYSIESFLFVKQFPCVQNANYPDMGCNFEMFTRHDMLELESLSPLTTIEPGDFVSHTEKWFLYEGFILSDNEDEVLGIIDSIIED